MMFAAFQSINVIPKRTRPSSLVRSLSTSAHSQTKSIRFYRLLSRQCKELDRICHEHRFLLRPRIIQQHEGLFSLSQNQEGTIDDVIHEFRRREAHETSKPPKYTVRVIKMDSHDAIATENNAPIDNSESGDDSLAEAEEESDDEEVVISLPILSTSSFPPSLWCRSLPTLQEAIRESFRQPLSTTSKDQLLPVYQYLAYQHRLWNRTSVSIQHNIRITAVAALLPRTATSISRLDRFGYRIRVENLHATDTIQLLGRSWVISYGPRQSTAPICVEAPNGGCVGQFPMIEPGCVFEYQSAAEADQRGSIEGELFFLSKERGKFTVPVETFELVSDD